MESNAVRALIARALETEFGAFQETLRQCPDLVFGVRPAHGHTVAWHALHIMDWTRCTIQWELKGVNPELTYGYLGFENEPWARVVKGPTLAYEQEPADKIRNVVCEVCEEALDAIWHAPQERFTSKAMWPTLKNPKPVVEGLMYHVTHTAYHRGQIRQVINEVNSLSPELSDPNRETFGERWRKRREAGYKPAILKDGTSIVQMVREDRGHTDDEQ